MLLDASHWVLHKWCWSAKICYNTWHNLHPTWFRMAKLGIWELYWRRFSDFLVFSSQTVIEDLISILWCFSPSWCLTDELVTMNCCCMCCCGPKKAIKSGRFGVSLGWINNNRIVIFTVPLKMLFSSMTVAQQNNVARWQSAASRSSVMLYCACSFGDQTLMVFYFISYFIFIYIYFYIYCNIFSILFYYNEVFC